ncbi:alpha/beta hydrolase family protein [Pedobacter agri]|uniref:alpha/beta hydrolase family protein n=1 Tax=Pedobacter agri TaxID=454586 RepID=UPI00292E7BD6|nr:alpha/beta fold hydrolase [Pedobacter agri]
MKLRRFLVLGLMFVLVANLAKSQSFSNKEISFQYTDGKITYGGILSLPASKKPVAAVVIVSGTGKQDRDGLMAGHKIFLELADSLAANGYAVLRTDDRGVGKTTGVYETSTTSDFASDALRAVDFLKTVKAINPAKIGLMGHSEGGMAISIAAAQSQDIDFLISLSGLAMNGFDALIKQNEDLVAASKMPEYDKERSNKINSLMFATALKYADATNMEEKLNQTYQSWKVKDDAYFKTLGIEFDHFRFPVYSYVKFAVSPWYRYFVRYNAAEILYKVKVPILAINGSRDLMVAPKENLRNWKELPLAGGNKDVTTMEFEDLNHLLLPCEVCDTAEIPKIKGGISPKVIALILKWLKQETK